MADMLSDALAILSDECKKHMSSVVVYRVGPADAVPAPAWQQILAGVGPVRPDEFPSLGGAAFQHTEARDFQIDPTDLTFGPGPFEPNESHEIDYTDAYGVLSRWRVCPRDGEPAWRYCDPSHTRIRVHTVRVSTDENLEPAESPSQGDGAPSIGGVK